MSKTVKHSTIKGWGGYPAVRAGIACPENITELQALLKHTSNVLPLGMGKSYGDMALQKELIDMTAFNKVLNEGEDWIEVQAGASLQTVLQHLLAAKKFLAVVPGIKNISIGGAIANDVHGKNHFHQGSFANQVLELQLLQANGIILVCSPETNAEIFYSFFGSGGLLGIVLSAKLKTTTISSSFLAATSIQVRSPKELFDCFESALNNQFVVSWMNLLSKDFEAVVKMANWHTDPSFRPLKEQPAINLPFRFPVPTPKWFFRWYNHHYFKKQAHQQITKVHCDTFFFPLESVGNWQYAFGPKGLLQYHCCLPTPNSREGMEAIIEWVRQSKACCTLAVLKYFGSPTLPLPHSFPTKGFNLALDFVHNQAARQLIEELDVLVKKYNGSVYKAKDALSKLPAPIVPAAPLNSLQNQRYQQNG